MTIVRSRWRHLAVFAIIGLLALVVPSPASAARSHLGVETRFYGAPDVTVTITLTEFSITPSSLSVPLGEPVTFSVTNTGGAQQNLTVEFDGPGNQTTTL